MQILRINENRWDLKIIKLSNAHFLKINNILTYRRILYTKEVIYEGDN